MVKDGKCRNPLNHVQVGVPEREIACHFTDLCGGPNRRVGNERSVLISFDLGGFRGVVRRRIRRVHFLISMFQLFPVVGQRRCVLLLLLLCAADADADADAPHDVQKDLGQAGVDNNVAGVGLQCDQHLTMQKIK